MKCQQISYKISQWIMNECLVLFLQESMFVLFRNCYTTAPPLFELSKMTKVSHFAVVQCSGVFPRPSFSSAGKRFTGERVLRARVGIYIQITVRLTGQGRGPNPKVNLKEN